MVRDLRSKLVLLSGPRQSGKSWLARHLASRFAHPVYLNWDNPQDRALLERQAWPGSTDLLILDEIHKRPDWKSFVKGVWDTRPEHRSMIVTGSARLEAYRQAGDSLAGRCFHHRLFPITPREAAGAGEARGLEHHLTRGGFPEPFLASDTTDAARWRRQYLDGLIREDVLSLETILRLREMNLLVELLRDRVASPLSYQGIGEDLGISPNTVRRYVDLLEALYIVFRIHPHHRLIARSLLQQPKLYFLDTGLVRGAGAALENLVAVSLARELALAEDADGVRRELRYLRTKEGREVDFLIVREGAPELMVEVKAADDTLAAGIAWFQQRHGFAGVQLVADLRLERDVGTVQVRRLLPWLESFRAEGGARVRRGTTMRSDAS